MDRMTCIFLTQVGVLLGLFVTVAVLALAGIEPTDGLDDFGDRIRKIFRRRKK